MNDVDTSFLERQQDKLAAQAGELIEDLENVKDADEEEYFRKAAAILEQYDRQKEARIKAERGEPMEKIFTVDEAAEYLKMKPNTIREWLKSGKLQGAKLGKEWRIMERDILALLENAREQTIADQTGGELKEKNE